MKKIIYISLMVAMLLSLSACGSTGEPVSSENGVTHNTADTNQGSESEIAETTEAAAPSKNDAPVPEEDSSAPIVYFTSDISAERASHDTHPNLLIRYLLNLWRNVKATGLYFLFGILLSALFQRYVPQDVFGGNEAWGVLMAATIGVPLYACGGGTIPLLQQWLVDGMSMGSASAFMITGPATKITNLGALKIAMGWKRFLLYIAFVMLFSFLSGLVVNLII